MPNPLTGLIEDVIELRDDAVATSGIDRRLWWDGGRPAHHLVDPRPAARLDRRRSARPPRRRARRSRRRSQGRGAHGAAVAAAESCAATAALLIDRGRRWRRRDPMEYAWWLASRASGIVALALIGVSVALGFAMAAKAFRKPGSPRILIAVHEHAAVAALSRSPSTASRCSATAGCTPARSASRCRSRWTTSRCSPGSASSPATWPRSSASPSTSPPDRHRRWRNAAPPDDPGLRARRHPHARGRQRRRRRLADSRSCSRRGRRSSICGILRALPAQPVSAGARAGSGSARCPAPRSARSRP